MLRDSRSVDPLQYFCFFSFFLLALARTHMHAQPNMKDSNARFVSASGGRGSMALQWYVSWHKSWPLPYPCDSLHKRGSVVMASE